MKHIIIITLLWFSLGSLPAQNPEKIYSFALVRKSTDYYKEQKRLWKNEVEKNNQNSEAWFNYYRTIRNLNRTDTSDKRAWNQKSIEEKDIIENMGKAVPESFEYNLCKWMLAGNDNKQLNYLKKALEKGKDKPEIFSEMINWGEVERNIKQRNEYASKWYHSEISSAGFLNYNYNVISGLKPNAILITAGDNDTYPVWQLQSQGIRTDVTVLNLSLLQIDDYRNKVFAELKIPRWDTTSLAKENRVDEYEKFKAFIAHLAKYHGERPLYVALTVDNEVTKPVEDKMYLTGLAYEYSTEATDNMALLRKNFEQVYALDYLDKVFYKDIASEMAKCLNQNYIVPMLKLYDHYKTLGDSQKLEWIKAKILVLAKESEEEKTIINHLNKK